MQILLTEQEYKALHDEVPDLRRIIAHLVHQLGGDVVVNREDLLEYSFSIAPRKSSSSNRNAIGSWHIQSRKPDEPWVK